MNASIAYWSYAVVKITGVVITAYFYAHKWETNNAFTQATNLIVDIDPDEAEKLIKLIELLMKEWYINREDRKRLFGDILDINAEKQAIRNGEG